MEEALWMAEKLPVNVASFVLAGNYKFALQLTTPAFFSSNKYLNLQICLQMLK